MGRLSGIESVDLRQVVAPEANLGCLTLGHALRLRGIDPECCLRHFAEKIE